VVCNGLKGLLILVGVACTSLLILVGVAVACTGLLTLVGVVVDSAP